MRFLKAFGIAIFVCLLFTMLTGSMETIIRQGKNGWDRGLDGWPIPGEYRAHDCVSGNAWKAHKNSIGSNAMYPMDSVTSFDLPVSSSRLFILQRGTLSAGSLRVETSDAVRRTVHVEVRVHYRSTKALDHANVCLLRRQEGENGVGIFTPTRWWHRSRDDNLFFDITVTIPSSGRDSPLNIKDFRSDLSNYVYHIDLPKGAVDFDSISLKTSNSPIYVETLTADNAYVESSNGPIRGSFNASRSLTLTTSNAVIRADVGLSYDDTSSDVASAKITTSNAPIEAAISMRTRRGTGGDFKVNAETSNNRLELAFPAAPVDSTLYVKAETSNSPASVKVHPTYEGGFSLRTSQYTPTIEKEERRDPSGRGRVREVWTSTVRKGFMQGSVEWVPSGEGRASSHIDLKSSNAGVTLKL